MRTKGKSWAIRELKKHFPKMVVVKADFSKIDDFANVKPPSDNPFYYSEYAEKKDGEWIVFNPELDLNNNKQ